MELPDLVPLTVPELFALHRDLDEQSGALKMLKKLVHEAITEKEVPRRGSTQMVAVLGLPSTFESGVM